MRLNMIVVITMWLPRVAWSQAGIAAQAAPKSAPPMMRGGQRQGPVGPGDQEADDGDAEPRPEAPVPRRRY